MKSRSHSNTTGDQGFGLVEVMVAMVIGMLGVIIMMQVFSVAEGQKRSTTGAGDAQNHGAMALYTLQRDIRQGGYGFSSDKVLGCALKLPAPPAAPAPAPAPASPTLAQLAPVIINPADVPAGDADTDTLLIAYGDSAGSPEGDAVTLSSTAAGVTGIQSPSNFAVGDQVIAAPSAPIIACTDPETPLKLGAVSAVTSVTVTLSASAAGEGDALFNLGGKPHFLAYAVRAGNLTVCDYITSDCSKVANYTPIASNIVSLRAEYGRASTAVIGVDTWDQATPKPTDANYACLWTRVKALRIAVVARNSQVDKDVLTAQAPLWEGSASDPIDLSGLANWQHFRYKVFETVIPIRNLPWMVTC